MHTREIHLQKLESFCRAVAIALTRAGLDPGKALETLRRGAAGACTRCGTCVGGEVLEALSQPPAPDSNATVRRLRLGDCSRPGCKSYFYRLSFQDLPGVDWNLILPQVEGINEKVDQSEIAAGRLRKRAVNVKLAARIGLGLGILVAVLMLRQWYYGGTIPLLREPEKFKVDLVTSGAEENH
jgi:hypothetical protein